MSRAWLGRGMLAVASTAVAVMAGEAAVRLLAPQPLRPAWDDVVEGIRVPRPSLRRRHVHPGHFDVRVSINSQRFRAGRDYAQAPPPGLLRVAVLGDSLAFGWGAEDEQTFPAVLQQRLSASVGAAVEVINAGFPGTCLGEKVAWYEHGVRPFRPQVVVLSLAGDDVDGDLFWRVFALDERGQAVRAPRPPAAVRPARLLRTTLAALPGTELLAERSHLFGLLRRGLSRLVSRERPTALGHRPATPEEVDTFHRRGLPLLRAELQRLQRLTREDGAALAVVFVPFRHSVYPDPGWWPEELRWKSAEISRAAEAFCAQGGVPFLDLTAALRAEAGRGAAALFHAGAETHPTPGGYSVIAASVARLLAQGPLIPATARR